MLQSTSARFLKWFAFVSLYAFDLVLLLRPFRVSPGNIIARFVSTVSNE
jgi:hypothetical protein